MTWLDDECSWCGEDASRHTWCDVVAGLVCQPCGHDEPCEEKP